MSALRIAQPGTLMDRCVRLVAVIAAHLLRNTQFIVIDRRTWERVA